MDCLHPYLLTCSLLLYCHCYISWCVTTTNFQLAGQCKTDNGTVFYILAQYKQNGEQLLRILLHSSTTGQKLIFLSNKVRVKCPLFQENRCFLSCLSQIELYNSKSEKKILEYYTIVYSILEGSIWNPSDLEATYDRILIVHILSTFRVPGTLNNRRGLNCIELYNSSIKTDWPHVGNTFSITYISVRQSQGTWWTFELSIKSYAMSNIRVDCDKSLKVMPPTTVLSELHC